MQDEDLSSKMQENMAPAIERFWRSLFVQHPKDTCHAKKPCINNICCWDCKFLEECVPNWFDDDGNYLNKSCKISHRGRWCSSVKDTWDKWQKDKQGIV